MMSWLWYNSLLITGFLRQLVVNPRRACAARVTVLGLCVCVSVTTFSAATRNETAKKRYQRVQCHTGFILKMAILVKMLRSKVMA